MALYISYAVSISQCSFWQTKFQDDIDEKPVFQVRLMPYADMMEDIWSKNDRILIKLRKFPLLLSCERLGIGSEDVSEYAE